MARRRRGRGLAWALAGLGSALAVLALGIVLFWGDLVSSALDPQVPFQTYTPPTAPDYAASAAWHLRPAGPARTGDADIFFIPPTTYDGGANWNARLNSTRTNRQFEFVMAPNYVGPFVSVGRVFAPRYRQASLYSLTTLREDAREARRFAYGDIREAFRRYLAKDNDGRPFVLVGVEQGGTLGWRLLADEIAPYPTIRQRLVAAYLIETITPADNPPVPPCMAQAQAGCLAAWARAGQGGIDDGRRMLDRALIWGPSGELENLAPRAALCFNPILGAVTDATAPERLHLGAANATGLEWGARPAFMTRQVSARCEGGLLKVSRPRSASLQQRGNWADRQKVPGFNLFYADLEADAKRRLAVWRGRNP